MDLLNLTILPSRGAKADFAGKAPARADFESHAAAAKGLAPPGPEPPPKAIEKPLGEEGAIREPNAPTQDLDFSPKTTPKLISEAGVELDFDLSEAELTKEGEIIPLPKEYAQGFALAAVAVMGPIVVPVETAVDEVEVIAESPAAIDEADSADGTQANLLRGNASLQLEGKELELQPTDGKDGKLIADVCPASDPPVRGEKQTEASSSRPIPSEAPKQRGEPEKTGPVATRSEIAEKLKAADSSLPKIEKVESSEETKSAPIPAHPTREEAVKAKLADRSAETKPTGEAPLSEKQAIAEKLKLADAPAPTSTEKASRKAPEVKLEKADVADRPGEIEKVAQRGASEDVFEADEPLLARRPRQSSRILIDPKLETTDLKNATPIPAGTVAVSEKAVVETRVTTKQTVELSIAQRESVIRQVVDRVESLAASNPRQNVTIHLDPKDFGSITLVVKRSGSEVDAEFYASHDAVRQALETNKSGLQSSLEQRGVQLNSMTVGNELANSSGRQEQASKEAAQQAQRHFAPRSERNEAPTYTLEAMRNLSRRATGVDLWI